ncbi:unnamed protein product [Pieris macdunnoughi]|nr:unnamed protein product [Pieris macdunnoughi]
MQEYLDLGHMEHVTVKDKDPLESVYLPHHGVIREDKTTTKVRVVFDASCKGTNGISLNQTLMVGPKLQQDLRHIIMRWRMHPICLSADIVKMYRQVVVTDADADFQRLVWREDEESEIKDYRLIRVTFGTACAPYLAVKTLQQLAIAEHKECPDEAEKIITDYYVDDLLTGCETVEEGVRIYKEMNNILRKGGFELQKWVTNNKELAAKVVDDGGNQDGKIELKIDEIVKILGLIWDKESDSFHYSVQLPLLHDVYTKRKVISDIARLYDPLGWLSPCIVSAKLMIQKLWLAGIDWDEALPDDLLAQWLTYRSELNDVSKVIIPRWIGSKIDSFKELHGFCDASSVAYAAAVYLRCITEDGKIETHLVAAKTKVAPVKQVSIPRLELLYAVLLGRLLTEVAKVLNVESKNVHGWTDSTVVLAWLSKHPSNWTTFIGNRTSDILSKLDNTQWAHVQTQHNPADVASRGCAPLELVENSLWLHGPWWLQNYYIEYARPKSISTDLEERTIKTYLVKDTAIDVPIWDRFSSIQRMIRVLAFCRRFLKIKEVNQKLHKFESYLTSVELNEALDLSLKECQRRELEMENTQLKRLNCYQDDRGIIRAQGRINKAHLPDDTKQPIILPNKSNFTNLIVDDAHKRTLHGGPLLMLNFLRTKYWIIGAKSLVKRHVHKCVTCIRYNASTKNQLMGQLPSARVMPARAFLNSGVDFAGPINIRMSKGRGNKSYKGYISLFVCMVTKAIHLEVVSDLTADSFIAAFKRFLARRGHVSDIWSDNGTNFVGASKELRQIVDNASVATDVREWLGNQIVTWHFIPPHAPNFGGLWEAGVKSTKFHLKRIVGDSTLTFEEMTTVLSQIEACLNSRPLSILPGDTTDPSPLTPGHFLVGEPLVVIPEASYEQSNISTLKRWQLTQRMMQNFWRRWSNEYLTHCLQRYKLSKLTPEPQIGDVVLVKEDDYPPSILPPSRWWLGRIVTKHPGLDNIVRVVTLKCKGVLLKRAPSKLCVLPIAV